jgi:nitronate monooxygenase
MTGDFEAMALYAGEGAGRIGDVPEAGNRLRAIAERARTRLEAIGRPEPDAG